MISREKHLPNLRNGDSNAIDSMEVKTEYTVVAVDVIHPPD